MGRGTIGEGEKGMGRKGGGGGQYTANQGSERTGIRARDFHVSKVRVPRDKGRDFRQQKGII